MEHRYSDIQLAKYFITVAYRANCRQNDAMRQAREAQLAAQEDPAGQEKAMTHRVKYEITFTSESESTSWFAPHLIQAEINLDGKRIHKTDTFRTHAQATRAARRWIKTREEVRTRMLMIKNILEEIAQELEHASEKFPAIQSYHEGYAILKEKVDELWQEIKSEMRTPIKIRQEAIQVAAMATRIIYDMERRTDGKRRPSVKHVGDPD